VSSHDGVTISELDIAVDMLNGGVSLKHIIIITMVTSASLFIYDGIQVIFK
jgi:hypothetical protein